jgi:site-specific recombinase XerD
MFLSEAIRDYEGYSRAELGHTQATIWTYRTRQRQFGTWLEKGGMNDPHVADITGAMVRRYVYSLTGDKLRPRSIRGALNAIRALFAYLVKMGALVENVALEVKLPKKDAAHRLLVSDEDLTRLLLATEQQRSEFRVLRDKALLSVLIFCGIRRQELLDLTVHNVNLDSGSLLVQHGKGERARTIYLCVEAVQALRPWLAMRGTLPAKHDGLFTTENHRRLGEQGLYTLLEDIKAIAGYKADPRIKPHSIRHAAATRLMRNGADIRSIQTWLGHAHLQTTAVYLHTDEEQARKIADLASIKPLVTAPAEEPNPETARPKKAEHYLRRRSRR